jgi:phosphomethylpyrimidine synthase
MTQLELARKNKITPQMRRVAKDEHKTPEFVRDMLATGKLVVPCNKRRSAEGVCGIGGGLRTKVNANIGTSRDFIDISRELAKLRAAEDAGADTVMDLSTGGDITAIRRRILDASQLPLGTVPIYEAACRAVHQKKTIMAMTAADMLCGVENHCKDGVDFITVHCGVTRDVLKELETSPRICGIVSRGGTFLAEWMRYRKQENPLYARFDELLDIAREYDVTLSLGDGLRPGALADAFDRPQVHELNVLAELAKRAFNAGVQAMIEGPGHVPLNQVAAQVQMQKELCHGAPFYVLGPLVTDVAPGYDHITSAIGGALAAMAGADFLCYVTPSEHLGLPGPEEVRQGVIAARIAAHAADVAKGIAGARDWDDRFSALRRKRDWDGMIKNSLDPATARRYRLTANPNGEDACSMCGEYCVFKLSERKRRTRK